MNKQWNALYRPEVKMQLLKTSHAPLHHLGRGSGPRARLGRGLCWWACWQWVRERFREAPAKCGRQWKFIRGLSLSLTYCIDGHAHIHTADPLMQSILLTMDFIYFHYTFLFFWGACIFEDSSPNYLLVLALKKMENVGWNNSNYDIRFCKFNRLLTCCCCTI